MMQEEGGEELNEDNYIQLQQEEELQEEVGCRHHCEQKELR